MKKNLFFVAAAALMLASCSNDVKIDENVAVVGSNVQKEIAFSPLAKKPNRKPAAAADTYQYAIDGADFPHELNMYVAAYQVEPTPGNFFEGTQFVYDNAGGSGASSGYWGGATPRYWPLYECYINFLAYANVTGTAAFNNTTPASAAVITQTNNSSAQTDLMYAIGNGAVTKNGVTNALVIPTNVNMEFKHAQAWMDFYVKANSETEEAITINSITLKGAKYSGTYTITHTNYNAKTSQSVAGAWSSLGDAANVAVPGWTSATLSDDAFSQVGNGLLIVPDDDAETNDWTSFVISYTSGGNDYEYEYTPETGAANVDQAKHYVFNITFKMHEIFVTATVADWTDADAVEKDVP